MPPLWLDRACGALPELLPPPRRTPRRVAARTRRPRHPGAAGALVPRPRRPRAHRGRGTRATRGAGSSRRRARRVRAPRGGSVPPAARRAMPVGQRVRRAAAGSALGGAGGASIGPDSCGAEARGSASAPCEDERPAGAVPAGLPASLPHGPDYPSQRAAVATPGRMTMSPPVESCPTEARDGPLRARQLRHRLSGRPGREEGVRWRRAERPEARLRNRARPPLSASPSRRSAVCWATRVSSMAPGRRPNPAIGLQPHCVSEPLLRSLRKGGG